MIVSFVYTVAPYYLGTKDVTRRMWYPDYMASFRPGTRHLAYTKSPRNGGVPLGLFEVVSLRREDLRRMIDDPAYGAEELQREGGMWKDVHAFCASFFNHPRIEIMDPVRMEFRHLEHYP